MRAYLAAGGLVSILVLTYGCASITRGSTEAFSIRTEPAGAKAVLSTGETCTTPCAIKLKRNAKFTVKLEKEGYETIESKVTHETAGAGAAGMAGNVLVGGIIGAAIDASTGATQRIVPNPLVVTMVKSEAPPATDPAAAPAPTETPTASAQPAPAAVEPAATPAAPAAATAPAGESVAATPPGTMAPIPD